jgi:alkylhydroperoxidase family enzyme
MTETPAEISDAMFAAAARYFDEAQLVELTATIALENYRARINRVFLVESEERYRPSAAD